jgi:hypothetical protein
MSGAILTALYSLRAAKLLSDFRLNVRSVEALNDTLDELRVP